VVVLPVDPAAGEWCMGEECQSSSSLSKATQAQFLTYIYARHMLKYGLHSDLNWWKAVSPEILS